MNTPGKSTFSRLQFIAGARYDAALPSHAAWLEVSFRPHP